MAAVEHLSSSIRMPATFQTAYAQVPAASASMLYPLTRVIRTLVTKQRVLIVQDMAVNFAGLLPSSASGSEAAAALLQSLLTSSEEGTGSGIWWEAMQKRST
jgi:hypothetical protein